MDIKTFNQLPLDLQKEIIYKFGTNISVLFCYGDYHINLFELRGELHAVYLSIHDNEVASISKASSKILEMFCPELDILMDNQPI
jgi:hypothetical protein